MRALSPWRLLAALALASAIPAAPGAAATLQVNGSGQLTGATGVLIDGNYYDVTFSDGSCNSLYSNCDPNTFPFKTLTGASDAVQALLDQVLIDGPAGNFDSHPELTLGCTATEVCSVLIPYSVDSAGLTALAAVNRNASGTDIPGAVLLAPSDDTGQIGTATFALFSTSKALPEPATWAMMILGFGAIGMSVRRRRQIPAPAA